MPLPTWTWETGASVEHGLASTETVTTSAWPMVLAGVSLALVSLAWLVARARPIVRRPSERLVGGLAGAAALGLAGPIYLIVEGRGSAGFALFAASSAPAFVVGSLACVEAWRRRAGLTLAIGGGLGALVAFGGVLHVATTRSPYIKVHARAHQHVGLAQVARAELPFPDLHPGGSLLVDAIEVPASDVPTERVLTFAAVRGPVRVERSVTIRIGRELGPSTFPLAEGNVWTFALRRGGSSGEPGKLEVRLGERVEDGPVHAIQLRRGSRLYAFEGELFLLHSDSGPVPLFVDPTTVANNVSGSHHAWMPAAPDAPALFALAPRLVCQGWATPSNALELPGPRMCRGRLDRGLTLAGALATVVTGGVALPFLLAKGNEAELELIGSTRGPDPSWTVPTAP